MKIEDKANAVIVIVVLFIYGIVLFYGFELIPMLVGWIVSFIMFTFSVMLVSTITTVANPKKKNIEDTKENKNENTTDEEDLTLLCLYASIPLFMGILLFFFLGETLLPIILCVMSLSVMYLLYMLDTEIKKNKIIKLQDEDINGNII